MGKSKTVGKSGGFKHSSNSRGAHKSNSGGNSGESASVGRTLLAPNTSIGQV